jgi:hypothetical protein
MIARGTTTKSALADGSAYGWSAELSNFGLADVDIAALVSSVKQRSFDFSDLRDVLRECEHVFGSAPTAGRWLSLSNPTIEDRRPVDLLVAGHTEAVAEMLARIAHGIVV